MYNGIKRKTRKRPKIKIPTKYQQIELVEEENNGYITTNYQIKTIDYAADPNMRWQDFEITNLLAAGVNPKQQGIVSMATNIEKIQQNAEMANEILDQYEIIKHLENERATEETN